MHLLLIVSNPKNWPLEIPGVDVIQARRYLTDPAFTKISPARVFNLCPSYRYQSIGYYVSLLAEARGHRPVPDVSTMRDLQSTGIIRLMSGSLEDMIQKNLASIQSDRFVLSIYFGRNLARKYDSLSLKLFNQFRAPLLRASFIKGAKWQLQNVSPISLSDVPDGHREFLVEAATEFFSGRRTRVRAKKEPRYYMGLLCGGSDPTPPSDERAIAQFIRAADKLGIEVDILSRDDISRLPEYDALFIRETTSVTDHTFRFARRAEAEGLVVIDDSESILKCTNKVFLAELMTRHKVRVPKTMIVHKDNMDIVPYEIGLPCILKQPDSSYSAGVVKVDTKEELFSETLRLLEKSELIIAQSFLPTPYDWRIGIVDGKPIYACKYFMASKHWQIIDRDGEGRVREGKVETVPVEEVPEEVVRTALRAAGLIGRGLYGVDLKHHEDKTYVVEVNDNPSIDAGYEDRVVKEQLYSDIMECFLRRLEQKRGVSA
ncbi:MAG: RimK family protein [Verrucomicrobia bacterium]|nr:RimK family protein [Verrucomicrobiota bacterium]